MISPNIILGARGVPNNLAQNAQIAAQMGALAAAKQKNALAQKAANQEAGLREGVGAAGTLEEKRDYLLAQGYIDEAKTVQDVINKQATHAKTLGEVGDASQDRYSAAEEYVYNLLENSGIDPQDHASVQAAVMQAAAQRPGFIPEDMIQALQTDTPGFLQQLGGSQDAMAQKNYDLTARRTAATESQANTAAAVARAEYGIGGPQAASGASTATFSPEARPTPSPEANVAARPSQEPVGGTTPGQVFMPSPLPPAPAPGTPIKKAKQMNENRKLVAEENKNKRVASSEYTKLKQTGELHQKKFRAAKKEAAKVTKAIERVQAVMKRSGWLPASGGLADFIKNLPGTDAFQIEKELQAIKAYAGFKTLQDMRESSPTGGALGSVAVPELELLIASGGGNLNVGNDNLDTALTDLKASIETGVAEGEETLSLWNSAAAEEISLKYGIGSPPEQSLMPIGTVIVGDDGKTYKHIGDNNWEIQ
jgi:hypothetical protein